MLEIACFNAESAIAASKAGADRIELCADYAAGGVTPLPSTLHQVRKETATPINVMIRPRGGDFVYSDEEFERMKTDIDSYKGSASGFVFGILDERNRVDIQRNGELVMLATPLPCTFHRAFDQTMKKSEAAEQLVECGFKAILTSGGLFDAVAGADKVGELQKDWGSKITIILGGGVRSSNISVLREKTRVEWYHSAAITMPGETVDPVEVEKLTTRLK
ncbi:hypothetical protein P280DRAFT_469692 [Massarina eburnea CBS 473.64]|uniref:Copper homeostasis protein cutC homolog n=1 Tax=Massarina eburnea CBS 473.64 TaxID=1395130 RepID=A0A6A6RYA4_9PLEO|nr:hypothetical protein P280DRAFT_469692 [Massarina eburnea CBS 473.64]